MRKVIATISLCIALPACAGVEADLETARYLLGKGGQENAARAADILEPRLKENPVSASDYEVIRLFAGAKMGEAGFDSVTIVASIVFPGEDSLIKILSDSIGDDLNAETSTFLQEASDAIDEAIASAGFDSLSDRVQRGLQFQRALVDLLKSMRVLIKVSDFNSSAFTAENCQTALADLDVASDGVGSLKNSRDRLQRDEDGVNLSAENALVTSLTSILGVVDSDNDGQIADMDDLTGLCNYLIDQKNT